MNAARSGLLLPRWQSQRMVADGVGVCVAMLLVPLLITTPGRSAVVVADEVPGYQRGVVAADHAAASAAGLQILQQGGNVVDAAVATSFALAVVRPASCGLGGGGFMVIWDAERRQCVTLDYRERAPAAATADMFLHAAADSTAEPGSVRGGLACGIPGTVAGLCLASKRYGRLPLRQVLQPAIQLCRRGVPADQHDLEVQQTALRRIRRYPNYKSRYAALQRLYLNNGQPWVKGEVIRSPLEKTLLLIAEHGADGFYRGAAGAAIAETIQAAGGVLTADDLADYTPTVREPVRAQFHGRDIFAMPPPSSGGVAVLQTLQTLQAWEQLNGRSLYDLRHNSTDYIHVVTEALKHAFADRAEFLGDSDYVTVPVQRLLSADYAQQMAAKIDLQRTLSSAEYGRFFSRTDAGTSHFSVMDAAGNAVACTETINLTFGSFVVVPEYGIVLNNEMDDFAAEPGKPNAFGLLQSVQNAVAPGKRPLSSMSPLIMVADGRAILASGASGGPRIITATLQQVLNRDVFGMTVAEAVSAARFHHQWSPNKLLLEDAIAGSVAVELQQRGHETGRSGRLAATQGTGASWDGDRRVLLQGGSDPRKHGIPAGF